MTNVVMLGLLAETPIHPGAGRSLGVIDLPVAREAATDYPVLVGSGLKGALRDRAERDGADPDRRHFGRSDQAGELLVSDGRLLLLPVRSLTGAYRWLTCPHLLERFVRDRRRALDATKLEVPRVAHGKILAAGSGQLVLEERLFEIAGPVPLDVTEALAPLVKHAETRQRLQSQVAIIQDDDFAWFVRYGLPIQARNVLNDQTKQSENLWYEEHLPPDTLMYALILGRKSTSLEIVSRLLCDQDPYLQVGGNETLGQGWMAVTITGGKA